MVANVLIQNGTLITPDKTLPLSDILIENGKIVKIGQKIPDSNLKGFVKIDAQGLFVLPGLIDIHTHGGNGSDFMDADWEAFVNIAKFQASHGVTTLIPTTIATSFESIIELLKLFSSHIDKDTGGAGFAGIHLEGPYLSLEHRGAHQAKYLITPERLHIEKLKEFKDIIKTITIAPEIKGALSAIKDFSSWGVLVSGGHDMAFDKIIDQAIQNGMSHTTHIFCVMSGLRKVNNFRTLGLNEYSLLDDRLTTEMIADNRHIPPLLAKLIYKCKGSKKLCLISDCNRATGKPIDGKRYTLGQKLNGGPEIIIADGIAMTPDGKRFAGSITTIDTMIRNMINDADIPINDAVRMATLTPAEIHKIEHKKGCLKVGNDGDICLVDSDFKVLKTIVAGKVVFPESYNERI